MTISAKSSLAAIALLLVAEHSAFATQIYYPDFSNTPGLDLTGSAATTGSVLRIVPAQNSQSGAAYSTSPITLGANDTFSTQFQFRLSYPGGADPADGFTFVLAANPTGLGSSGYGLGYAGVPNSVAIEFDTYFNGPYNSLATNGGAPNQDDFDSSGNASSNHIAIDTSGYLTNSNLTDVYGIASCGFPYGRGAQSSYAVPGCLSNGDTWTATITYDGTNLNVSVTDPTEPAAFTGFPAYSINIVNLLGTDTAYVGFTASTGSGYQNADILSWQFSNTAALPPAPTTSVPEPASLLLLGTAAALAFGLHRRGRFPTA